MHVRRMLSRRWRSVYLIAILFLAAANLGVSHAAIEPTGIVNKSFGKSGECNLNGWTTSGQVETGVGISGNCYAVLISRSQPNPGGRFITTTSRLSQGFLVGQQDVWLGVFLQPSSDNPSAQFDTQTVSLYDATGTLIYQKSRNAQIASSSEVYHFTYDLSGRVGQYIELRISVTSSSNPALPNDVRMNVDFDGNPVRHPEVTPGPGW